MLTIRNIENSFGVFLVTILIILGIGYLDYMTSPELSFSLFYLIPISILALYRNTKFATALLTTVFASIVCFLAEYYSRNGTSFFYPIWNSVMRLIIFSSTILVLWYLKEERTKHIKAEELLRLSEEKYRTIIDNIGEGVGFTDPGEQFVFANSAAERIFHVDAGKLVGKNLNEFISSDQLKLIQKQTFNRSQGEASVYELIITLKNGENRTIIVTAVPRLDQNGGFLGTYGVFRDITEQKETEKEIQFINERLEKLNFEKDKFFSIIAHDLRGPFNGFLGLTNVMATELGQMSHDEIQDISELLHNSANNLYDLLGNLLEWSKIQRGLIVAVPESFLLLPRIIEDLKSINDAAKKKEIRLDFDVPNDLMVHTDSNMLSGILRNIANNAVKFTPSGGRIIVSAKLNSNNKVEISIKDSGVGMNNQIIDNLFRLDVNTSRKGTEGESSTGMGLIICKDLIEKLGGDLKVQSEEGKGSEFKFTIPYN